MNHRAVVNHQTLRNDIALNVSGLANFHALVPVQAALHVPAHQNLASFDIRRDAAMRTDRHLGFEDSNLTLNLAVNVKIFAPRDFAFDGERRQSKRRPREDAQRELLRG